MIEHEGLRLMRIEMAAQCGDALASMDAAVAPAGVAAASARAAKRLVLYGMGGSHFVNRAVEPLYRELGLDCTAVPASEALMSPLPDQPRAALIVSQSGESGEIVELLARPARREARFGLTLDAASTLGRSTLATLVAAGGPEQAFAATRSIVLTVALHAAMLEVLGADQPGLRAVFAAPPEVDIAPIDAALAGCDVVAFAGRHVMQGIAQSGALSMMELARIATIGFEAGQFRHGPYEFLRPGLGVILLRSAGPDAAAIPPIAAATVAAGCTTIVLDASGGAAVPGCVHVVLPTGAGLAAAVSVLLTLQRLNIAVALRRIPAGVGTPLRTTKVTV
jgi:fructoselysine-6-P-deglycase FrlB-like protein